MKQWQLPHSSSGRLWLRPLGPLFLLRGMASRATKKGIVKIGEMAVSFL